MHIIFTRYTRHNGIVTLVMTTDDGSMHTSRLDGDGPAHGVPDV